MQYRPLLGRQEGHRVEGSGREETQDRGVGASALKDALHPPLPPSTQAPRLQEYLRSSSSRPCSLPPPYLLRLEDPSAP